MINLIKYEDLGSSNTSWLQAKHHFSFANYYNEDRMSFGTLRVVNDDKIASKGGFAMHHHDNMEIITYVRSGAISHEDSFGNKGVTEESDVQVMSAGTGIRHSEYNLTDKETSLYQIWLEPKELNIKPRWEQKKFPKDFIDDKLHVLASRNEGLFINQDAILYGGKIKQGTTIIQNINYQGYILISKGEFLFDDIKAKQGDAIEVIKQDNIKIEAIRDGEIVLIDAP